MADKRISQLIERTDIANNDVLPIVASGATTTNKVTISTIQEWMQDNLDVGVTSVGITIGSTGTDINVTGSPITTSGNITINIPTASATNRGLLSSSDWTTFNNKLSSVGLTMPSAFTVSNSPLTANGTIAVTGAGTVSQYIRGDGSLADFPQSSGGGGASVSYYLNGSVSQGTIGGVAYLEMSKTPILGAGTNFTINANGYIASFITDAGDPNLLLIPGGNWNFETYFAASSGGGTPSFYVELYKVSGSTATLVASNSANPELIAFGTTTTAYFSSLAVPATTLTLTDRLALRYYVTHAGRTITLHTENSNLCQIITTFTTGLTALNGLTAQVQNFATGTSGTDFNISSTSATHTFNLPDASASNRGAVTTGAQTIAGNKTLTRNIDVNGVMVGRGASSGDLFAGIAGNTSVGSSALISITTGFPNTALGSEALRNITTGANNIAIGSEAGKIDSGSSTANATSSSSIYIGNSTKPQTNGNTNEIVIGHAASGNGSNSVTIGNSSTTFNKFFGATQSDTFRLPSDGGGNQVTIIENIGTIHEGTASINKIGFNNSNNIYFGKGLSNGGVIQWTNAAVRYYTLPDADGTIALTSDLGNYIQGVGTTDSIPKFTGSRTIANSAIRDTTSTVVISKNVSVDNGASQAINLTPASGGTTNRIETTGTLPLAIITSGSSITLAAGGVTPQFTLASTGAVTLTGALNGTSASFTGDITASSNAFFGTFNGNDKYHFEPFTNAAGGANNAYFVSGKIDNNERSGFVFQARNSNGEEYNAIIVEGHNSTSTTTPLSIASTGAATFSSSVTATQGLFSSTVTAGTGTTSGYSVLGLIDPGTGSARYGSIRKNYDSPFDLRIRASNSEGEAPIVFDLSNDTEAMRITSAGNVGIGTASPSNGRLEVLTSSAVSYNPASFNNVNLALRSGGGATTGTIVGLTMGIGGSAETMIGAVQTASGTADIVFQSFNGSSYGERMRITSGGNVLVGNTVNDFNSRQVNYSTTSYTFHSVRTGTGSEGHLVFSNGNGVVGSIFTSGTSTFYNATSDYRLKEDLQEVKGLEKVEAIKVYDYKWKSDETRMDGVLAHELAEVLPYAVTGEKDEVDENGNDKMQAVDYSKIVPVLIKAIQEQQEQIKSLTEQVEALKSQING